jgi:hypothetical protein
LRAFQGDSWAVPEPHGDDPACRAHELVAADQAVWPTFLNAGCSVRKTCGAERLPEFLAAVRRCIDLSNAPRLSDMWITSTPKSVQKRCRALMERSWQQKCERWPKSKECSRRLRPTATPHNPAAPSSSGVLARRRWKADTVQQVLKTGHIPQAVHARIHMKID